MHICEYFNSSTSLPFGPLTCVTSQRGSDLTERKVIPAHPQQTDTTNPPCRQSYMHTDAFSASPYIFGYLQMMRGTSTDTANCTQRVMKHRHNQSHHDPFDDMNQSMGVTIITDA